MGLSFQFGVNTAGPIAVLRKARSDLAGPLPARLREGYRQAGVVYLRAQHQRFLRNAAGGGDWRALAESTVEQKRREGEDRGILRRSDRLLDSLEPGHPDNVLEVLPGGKGVRAGTKVPYGKFHAKRTRHRPARLPVAPPDAATKRKMQVPIARAFGLQAREWSKVSISRAVAAAAPKVS